MIHLYEGDGKGKTTAACGLVLRALGRGWRVVLLQFLKDGSSGEIQLLSDMPGCRVIGSGEGITFSFRMTPGQKEAARTRFAAMAEEALRLVQAHALDMLVLDEVCAAINSGLLEQQQVLDILDAAAQAPEPGIEVVLTGRNPPAELCGRADYHTEFLCRHHPYQSGVQAREGIEY